MCFFFFPFSLPYDSLRSEHVAGVIGTVKFYLASPLSLVVIMDFHRREGRIFEKKRKKKEKSHASSFPDSFRERERPRGSPSFATLEEKT